MLILWAFVMVLCSGLCYIALDSIKIDYRLLITDISPKTRKMVVGRMVRSLAFFVVVLIVMAQLLRFISNGG